jgi:cell division protein FtsW
MLYSAGMWLMGGHYLMMQLAWCGLGMAAGVTAFFMDYRHLKKWVWVFWGLSLVLLVLVFVPHVGAGKINGARRWIDLHVHNLHFQPSEVAKLALILLIAWYGERHQKSIRTFTGGILIPGALAASVLVLIFLEPDWGTTLLLAVTVLGMLLMAGIRLHYFLVPVLLGGAGLAWMIWNDPMRLARVMAFLDLEGHKDTVGYQGWQSILALGSGGWFGLGLGNGHQKMGFLPEHHTDFILAVTGEELGLAATLSVVAVFVLFVLCGFYIASRAADVFGSLLASGLTMMIGLQAAINIGVACNTLPNKGLPLPFISYGGSNLLIMLASVGLLLSIARRAPKSVHRPEFISEPEAATTPF